MSTDTKSQHKFLEGMKLIIFMSSSRMYVGACPLGLWLPSEINEKIQWLYSSSYRDENGILQTVWTQDISTAHPFPNLKKAKNFCKSIGFGIE
jgi:hypothetical protein